MNIDRELQAALDVDPSPEFVARVRMRVASEPAPRSWRSWWWMATAITAVAVIVIATMVSRDVPARKPAEAIVVESRQVPPAASVPAAQDPSAARARPVEIPRREQPGGVDSASGGRLRPRASVVVTLRDLPPAESIAGETLIDAREAATLRRLIASVGAGRVDLKSVLDPAPFTVADTAPLDEIQIAPISIEPLPTSGEGARQ